MTKIVIESSVIGWHWTVVLPGGPDTPRQAKSGTTKTLSDAWRMVMAYLLTPVKEPDVNKL